MATVRCRTCGETFSSSQSKCPNCGTKRAKGGRHAAHGGGSKTPLVILIIVLVLALLAAVYFIFFRNKDGEKKPTDHTPVVSAQPSPEAPVNTDVLPIEPSESPTAPPVTDAEVEYIVLNAQDVSLDDDHTSVQLTAVVYPAEAQSMLEWTSENPEIATVDKNGLVTAVASGTATVCATAGDQISSCIVRVELSPPQVKLELYTIYNRNFSGDMSLSYGETVQMYVAVDGTQTNEGVTWSSDRTSVATVNGDGVVKGVGGGTAHITATYNGQTVSCICRVG